MRERGKHEALLLLPFTVRNLSQPHSHSEQGGPSPAQHTPLFFQKLPQDLLVSPARVLLGKLCSLQSPRRGHGRRGGGPSGVIVPQLLPEAWASRVGGVTGLRYQTQLGSAAGQCPVPASHSRLLVHSPCPLYSETRMHRCVGGSLTRGWL